MQYILSKQFEKDFAKLPKRTKQKVLLVLELFLVEPSHPSLRVHSLRGRYVGHHSLDVTGDVRAVYFVIQKDLVRFVTIGTHSELYG